MQWTTPHYAAATAILAGSASAFVAPAPLGLPARHCRSPAAGVQMVLVGKPGTGKNRMTETKFDQPLVEKKEFPGTIHGYQVCGDLLPLLRLSLSRDRTRVAVVRNSASRAAPCVSHRALRACGCAVGGQGRPQ